MKTGFIMMSKLLSTASAAALATILAMPGHAGEIDVAGNFGSLTFTAKGGNTLEVSSAGFGGTASYFSSPLPPDPLHDFSHDSSGSATFGSTDFLTGPEVFGIFTPIPPANQTFSYSSITGPLDTLMADITWTELDANAPLGEPQLIGTGVIGKSGGDSTFTMDFPVGGGINIIANFPLPNDRLCDLTQLAAGPPTCMVNLEIASFEGDVVTPGPIITTPIVTTPGVPEPMSSFVALGIALCCLWGAYQVTRRESERSMC